MIVSFWGPGFLAGAMLVSGRVVSNEGGEIHLIIGYDDHLISSDFMISFDIISHMGWMKFIDI